MIYSMGFSRHEIKSCACYSNNITEILSRYFKLKPNLKYGKPIIMCIKETTKKYVIFNILYHDDSSIKHEELGKCVVNKETRKIKDIEINEKYFSYEYKSMIDLYKSGNYEVTASRDWF